MNRSLALISTLLVLPVGILTQTSANATSRNAVELMTPKTLQSATNSSLQTSRFLAQGAPAPSQPSAPTKPSTPTQAQTHFQQASEYFKQRKYEQALAEFNKVIELEPNNELAYLGRATIYLGQKDWNSALDNFNQAIKFDPKLALAYFGRGVVRLQVEGRDSGVADLKVAAQLFQEQKDTEGYQQVTSILKELGE
jgi:tetratricopeptide (TPR) repeat protein